MEACITPYPDVKNSDEVAGGELKKFPARLFAVPPRISNEMVPGVTVESYQEDNKLWKKHVASYKRAVSLLGTTRYHNIMDMNAGLGGFAAALDSPKLWVMNVVPTIADNTLGVVYERGLIGIYHDWYASLMVSYLLFLRISAYPTYPSFHEFQNLLPFIYGTAIASNEKIQMKHRRPTVACMFEGNLRFHIGDIMCALAVVIVLLLFCRGNSREYCS